MGIYKFTKSVNQKTVSRLSIINNLWYKSHYVDHESKANKGYVPFQINIRESHFPRELLFQQYNHLKG